MMPKSLTLWSPAARCALIATLFLVAVAQASAEVAQGLGRIRIATLGVPDAAAAAALYERWLGYEEVEAGNLDPALAASWGTPAMAGRRYVLLRPESGDNVYLRPVEITFPEGYRPMRSYGWNAVEILVQDPDAVYERLSASPFEHVGGPANLDGDNSSIRATQFKDPWESLFYFTAETGDLSQSMLMAARSTIDRPFIMVAAGPDADAMAAFYERELGAELAFMVQTPIDIIARAQGLPEDHRYPLGFLRLAAFSNGIEVDGYPAQLPPRPRTPGELPPGPALASFSIDNLDDMDPALFRAAPLPGPGAAYAGARTVTVTGAAGELIELIEEPLPE